MFDVVAIDERASEALDKILDSRTSVWHQVSDHFFIKKDGDSGNILIRGDHPMSEGSFYVPAGQVLPLAAVLKKLADLYVEQEIERLKEEVGKEKKLKK